MPIFTDPMDITESLVSYQTNVRAFRLEKGWTPEELARAARCSTAHVINLEAGRSAGSLHLFFRLARALRCSLDDLVSPNN